MADVLADHWQLAGWLVGLVCWLTVGRLAGLLVDLLLSWVFVVVVVAVAVVVVVVVVVSFFLLGDGGGGLGEALLLYLPT